jgi:hypothetical protein
MWFTEGSLRRAMDKLESMGVVNSYGRPYSIDGVRKSAVKYMVANYEESKQVLIESYRKFGYEVIEDDIERYMIKLAISAFTTNEAVIRWLKKTGLYGKHRDFVNSYIEISYDD